MLRGCGRFRAVKELVRGNNEREIKRWILNKGTRNLHNGCGRVGSKFEEREVRGAAGEFITRLSNGIRVVTNPWPGAFSGVGLYVDAGSRYESDSLRGVSHMMDRLAFKSTLSKSSDEMLEAMEGLGGNIQCSSAREALVYQCATFNQSAEEALSLITESIREAKVTDDEVAQQVSSAQYELREVWSKPELILPEILHWAAYNGRTLGHTLMCPMDRLTSMSRNLISEYRERFFQPQQFVVACVGVPHGKVVGWVEKFLGDMPAFAGLKLPSHVGRKDIDNDTNGISSTKGSTVGLKESSPQLQDLLQYVKPVYEAPKLNAVKSSTLAIPTRLSSGTSDLESGTNPATGLNRFPAYTKNLSTSRENLARHAEFTTDVWSPHNECPQKVHARYTGGFTKLPVSPWMLANTPNQPPLAHVHVAFEALPVTSRDIYAVATLQILLGGGGSFSAGGPGKGMYSRLYTNVLNQHGWVESCTAFNHSYTDSGLFGISASCLPTHIMPMIDVICRELKLLLAEGILEADREGRRNCRSVKLKLSEGEVQRAKNQLKSSLLMNLESRIIELEDLGRQVQVHNRKVSVSEMCERIDELSGWDLHKVATRILTGRVNGDSISPPTVVIQEPAEMEGYSLSREILESSYAEQIRTGRSSLAPAVLRQTGPFREKLRSLFSRDHQSGRYCAPAWCEIQDRIKAWGLGGAV